MKIILIRHLESIANVRKCYAGWSDVSLTENGIKKGNELSLIYNKWNLDGFLFFSSSLNRARKSLEIMFPNKKYSPLDGLRETNFGIFEMKTYNELKNTSEYQKWISGDFVSNACPNGESYLMMKDRVINTFNELLKLNKDLLIVSHAGPIGVIMRYLLNDESENIFKYDSPNGEGYIIDFEKRTYQKTIE